MHTVSNPLAHGVDHSRAFAASVVFDVVMGINGEIEIVRWSPAYSANDLMFEEDEAIVEGVNTDEIDDETFYEAYPEMRDLEMIDDNNELARILLGSGLYPYAHLRIEALFRRAAAGKGEYSQLLAASGMII